MTTQELKQQAREEFDKKYKEVEFLHGVPVDLPNYYREKIKSFLDSIIDKTVQQTEERIVGEAILAVVYACAEYTNMQQDIDNKNVAVNTVRAKILPRLQSLITNNSDINK